MKTIITIFLFFVCSFAVGQQINIGGRIFDRALPTYVKKQAKVTDMYPSVVNDWMYETLLKEITTLKAEVVKLKAGTGSDSITVLRQEIEKLKAETVTLVFKGFKKVDSTGDVQTIELDQNVLEPKKYTEAQRDALTLQEAPVWTIIINTTKGKINIRAPQGWAAVTSSNIFQ